MNGEKDTRVVCIYHIAELYLFEYYENPGDYVISREDLIAPLVKRAGEQERMGGYVGAMQNWQKAAKLNPARTDIAFHLVSCSYHLKDLDGMLSFTKAVYPYVCTRAELAAYYRWRGLWCLEKYQPELARALYRYSTWFEESREAENEIRFLDTALPKNAGEEPGEKVIERIRDAGIPETASTITMALVYRASEEALREGNRMQALDCLKMVYDLTRDEEVEEKIRSISGS